MADTPGGPDSFVQGLDLGHLNPPDIEAFFGGLPGRVSAQLVALDRRAPTDAVVDRLTAIIDFAEALIERLTSAGYALGTHAEADPIGRTEPGGAVAIHPAVDDAIERVRVGATEIARRLSGIPAAGWQADPQLLPSARMTVGELAAALRSLGDAISTANEHVSRAARPADLIPPD